MDGEDHLSALSDDLLRLILHFVPFKEAASTSVLSRRWRSLWRSSGAVNLDVRVHEDKFRSRSDYDQREKAFFSRRDVFVRNAEAALDAADAHVTRLTLRVEDPKVGRRGAMPKGNNTNRFLHRTSDPHTERDVLRAMLSHPAARHVEEIRIAAVNGTDGDTLPTASDVEDPDHEDSLDLESYELSSLPQKAALRVLDLTRCGKLPAMGDADAFPRLETLRLRLCSIKLADLQALMDAALGLGTVHLESVFFKGSRDGGAAEAPFVRLRCRAVTELVLEFCGMEGQHRYSSGDRGSIEIDAPRLRYLRYKGTERRFSLAAPVPDMAVLELVFLQDRYHYEGHDYDKQDKTRVLFWQFVRNFTDARVLKLKVNGLEDIAVCKARRAELLCTFPNAARLDLEGAYHPAKTKAAAVTIANLLRCCPAARDLRLRLITVPSNSVKNVYSCLPIQERKGQLDYEKSVDRFMRRRRLNPAIPLDENGKHDEVPDGIPGLSGHSLTCLQGSLRRVGLQFRMDGSSCFGTRLVKFFTDNAMVLEQMCVDSGNHKLCEHMNLSAERWIIAPTSSKVGLKRKNLEESSLEFSKIPRKSCNARTDLTGLATSFTIVPLER
ncbi:unnamed protein product [Urochloa humidicola]